MTALGLTNEDGMTQVWFVAENGRLTGSAEAVNEVMKQVWWLRPFAFLYHIPGLKQLEESAYRWVANNRYRLPGGTAECAIEAKSNQ
jgi:predicted DCC family thiol-disulfide oxidoreductase YuxK